MPIHGLGIAVEIPAIAVRDREPARRQGRVALRVP